MFRALAAALPGVPLLANMTEFGRTPVFTAAEFESMGYAMVIWPVSALRCAARTQKALYASLAAEDATTATLPAMQTRSELYDTIGYFDYEEPDSQIACSQLAPTLT